MPLEPQGQVSEALQDVSFDFSFDGLSHVVEQDLEDSLHFVGHKLLMVAGDVRDAGEGGLEQCFLLHAGQAVHDVPPVLIQFGSKLFAVVG